LDAEEGSKRTLVAVASESSAHRLENFRYRRTFLDSETHLSSAIEVTL
jgi:hypothetical protein